MFNVIILLRIDGKLLIDFSFSSLFSPSSKTKVEKMAFRREWTKPLIPQETTGSMLSHTAQTQDRSRTSKIKTRQSCSACRAKVACGHACQRPERACGHTHDALQGVHASRFASRACVWPRACNVACVHTLQSRMRVATNQARTSVFVATNMRLLHADAACRCWPATCLR